MSELSSVALGTRHIGQAVPTSTVQTSVTTVLAPTTAAPPPATTSTIGVIAPHQRVAHNGPQDVIAIAGLNAAVLGLLAIALVLRIEAAFSRLQKQDELVLATADRVNFGRLPVSMVGSQVEARAADQTGRRFLTTKYRHIVEHRVTPEEGVPATASEAEMEALMILSSLTNRPPLNNCKPFGTITEVREWVEQVDGIVLNGALWSYLSADHHIAKFAALQSDAMSERVNEPLPARPSVLSGDLAAQWDAEQRHAADQRRAQLRTTSIQVFASAQDVVRNAVLILSEVRDALERRSAYETTYPRWLRVAPGALAAVFVPGVVTPLCWSTSPRWVYVWAPALAYVAVSSYAIVQSARGYVPKPLG